MGDGELAADLARLFASGKQVQESRLLRMDFPHDDGPPDTALLVNSLRAHEEMSRDFRFEVELLSDNLHLPLTAMMGRMVTISMVRDDASLRYFNGYIGEFRLLRSDGGFAVYQMVLTLAGVCQAAHGQRFVSRTQRHRYQRNDLRALCAARLAKPAA